MNLGYLLIRDGCKPERPKRAELARELGFSEFYTADTQGDLIATKTPNGCPELAASLRTMSNLPIKPGLQVAAINGKEQLPRDAAPSGNITRPSITPEQVMANAERQQATLSVSWLNQTELARHWAALVAGSTHAGHRARPEDWRVARTIVVSSDAERAEAAIKSDNSPCRAYYAKMAGSDATPSEVDTLLERCVLFGSLNSVLEELHEIAISSGPFGTLTLIDHAWPDEELAQQSVISLAGAIAPVTQRNRITV